MICMHGDKKKAAHAGAAIQKGSSEMELVHQSSTSPFDSIRQVAEDGTERWSVRQLMPLLGYEQWRRFADSIDRAKMAAANQGMNVEETFCRLRQEVEMGRPREDYKLSRYAAYLIAMNGDPRKPEVAAAQSYFAVRTREAEVASVLSDEQIVAQALQITSQRVAVLEQQVNEQTPKVEFFDTCVSHDDAMTVKDWGAQFGVGERKARELLVGSNIIYRKFICKRWSETKQCLVDEYEYRACDGRVTYD